MERCNFCNFKWFKAFYGSHLKREVVEDDIVRLTEIKIKRISKFDIDKAQIKIEAIEDELDKIAFNLR